MYERFSPVVRTALELGKDRATRSQRLETSTGDVLLGLFRARAFDEFPRLAALQRSVADFEQQLTEHVSTSGTIEDVELVPHGFWPWIWYTRDYAFCRMLSSAIENTRRRGSKQINLIDVFLAILATRPNIASDTLQRLGVDLDGFAKELAADGPVATH